MNRSLEILALTVTGVLLAVPAFASAVPEMDPSIASSAMILLVGGVVSLIEWRRRK
jgi:uncharacterized membrane protein YfcA